jgi:predicted kinase
VLLLLNGPPGIGKSSVARRWADAHPRALLVEVDELRTRLGGWSDDEGTMSLARELALDLIAGHLRRGYDVVVPQYVGRPEFRDRLSGIASELDVGFVEVVLTAPDAAVGTRFRARRSELAGADHPESDLPDDGIDAAIDDAATRLSHPAELRRRIPVDASGDVASTYDALQRALARIDRPDP